MSKRWNLTKQAEMLLLQLLKVGSLEIPDNDTINHRHYTLIRKGLAFKGPADENKDNIIFPTKSARKWLRARECYD